MNKLTGTIKGFFIGIANIIPGISGGTLMVVFNLYERVIDAFLMFSKHPIKAFKQVWDVVLGILLGLITAFVLLGFTFKKYPLVFILFFIGLVLGGLKPIIYKIKDNVSKIDVPIFIFSFIFVVLLPLINPLIGIYSGWQYYIILILLGLIVAFSSIAPGISGSLLLIVFGYYAHILQMGNDVIKSLINFQFNEIVPFILPFATLILSFIVGFYLSIKFIKNLLINYKSNFYVSALGMLLASPIAMLLMTHNEHNLKTFNYINWIIGVILLIIGFSVVFIVGYIESRKEQKNIQEDQP